MQSRGGYVPVRAADSAIRLELIDPVQRHVEPVTTLVLHHRDFEGRAVGAYRDGLQPAVNADPVLEMYYVPARREWARRRGRDRTAIPARSPQPPSTAEDLVIGEHAQRRHDESAVQRPHGKRRPVGAEQLLQSFELSLVVAENHGGQWFGDDLPQTLQVAIDMLRRREWKALLRFCVRHRDTGQGGQTRPPCRRLDEQLFPRRGFFAHPPGDLADS